MLQRYGLQSRSKTKGLSVDQEAARKREREGKVFIERSVVSEPHYGWKLRSSRNCNGLNTECRYSQYGLPPVDDCKQYKVMSGIIQNTGNDSDQQVMKTLCRHAAQCSTPLQAGFQYGHSFPIVVAWARRIRQKSHCSSFWNIVWWGLAINQSQWSNELGSLVEYFRVKG